MKIFMAKWDVKDGFWRMMCEEGEEWNFDYVLPQRAGEPIKLVVPTSLQMGWVESPPYFCAASETARDVAMDYANTKLGSLPTHKFPHYTQGGKEATLLPVEDTARPGRGLRYSIEVYVDDFMSIVIPSSKAQLDHVATAIMRGIHDIFPADIIDSNDPISGKKQKKGEAQFSTFKTLLSFDFDRKRKTMWLEEGKRAKLLTTLKGWIRSSDQETQCMLVPGGKKNGTVQRQQPHCELGSTHGLPIKPYCQTAHPCVGIADKRAAKLPAHHAPHRGRSKYND
jgi:hypothetical protein